MSPAGGRENCLREVAECHIFSACRDHTPRTAPRSCWNRARQRSRSLHYSQHSLTRLRRPDPYTSGSRRNSVLAHKDIIPLFVFLDRALHLVPPPGTRPSLGMTVGFVFIASNSAADTAPCRRIVLVGPVECSLMTGTPSLPPCSPPPSASRSARQQPAAVNAPAAVFREIEADLRQLRSQMALALLESPSMIPSVVRIRVEDHAPPSSRVTMGSPLTTSCCSSRRTLSSRPPSLDWCSACRLVVRRRVPPPSPTWVSPYS